MATLIENTKDIRGVFEDIKTAIEDKGIAVADGVPVTKYATLISAIATSEGGSAGPKYMYYRLTITDFRREGVQQQFANIAELTLYDDEMRKLHLITNGVTCTASSYTSSSGEVPANVLDGNASTVWHSDYSNAPSYTNWLKVKFPAAIGVSYMGITVRDRFLDYPASFILEGSNDDVTYTELLSVSDCLNGWGREKERLFGLENGLYNMDFACYEVNGATSLTGTIHAEAGDIVLATITARSAMTLPDTLTLLNESDPIVGSDGATQTMTFAYQKITDAGDYEYTIHQEAAGRLYLNLIVLEGIKDIKYTGKYCTAVSGVSSVTVPPKTNGELLIWGCSSVFWNTSTPYGNWTSTLPFHSVSLDGTSTQPRQANFFDFDGEGERTFTAALTNNASGNVIVVDAVELIL